MKKVLKEIERKEIVNNNIEHGFSTSRDYDSKQILTIETYDSLVWHTENLKLFLEVEEPETIKEFLQQKEITKNELLEWLNENYK